MALYAGQGVGLVRRVQPAGEIVREIAEEARAVVRRLGAAAGNGAPRPTHTRLGRRAGPGTGLTPEDVETLRPSPVSA